MEVRGLEEIYAPGDPVELILENRHGVTPVPRTRISLSIARSGVFDPCAPGNHFRGPGSDALETDRTGNLTAPRFLPDLEGLQVTGSMHRRNHIAVPADELVILSLIDSITEIYSTTLDSLGRFRFDLNGLTGRKDMIIQALSEEEGLLIDIDPDYSMEPVPDQAWRCMYREGLQDMFGKMLLARQVTEAYWDRQPGSPGNQAGQDGGAGRLPFYGHYDHRVVMDDYIKLPVMEEVFRELGKRVFLEREKGTFRVKLLDVQANRIIGDHPYFFLDGVPFFDSGKLLELDPERIESIRLKSQKYFAGDLIMDGIIDIRSREVDGSLLEFPVSAVRQYFDGFEPGSSAGARVTVPETGDDRIPVYMTTLLYLPGSEMEPAGKKTIRFRAPDATGTYDVILRGILDNGEHIEAAWSFRVTD